LARAGTETVAMPAASDHSGDGSLGILEGYASRINPDGSQPVRSVLRADCQAESAMVLAMDSADRTPRRSHVIARNLLDFTYFTSELRFRGEAHHDLVKVLRNPAVRAGLKCGPLTTPNHKLVPDSRWVADLPDDRVIARANGSADRGVALVVTSRFAILKQAWTDANDDALIQLPPPGFKRVATSRFYGAYVRC